MRATLSNGEEPPAPTPLFVAPNGARRFAPGSTVKVSVVEAEDKDTCSRCGVDQAPEADVIKYLWTQGRTGTEDALTVTMPATQGQTIEVAVDVDDEANLSGDGGTRDDEAAALTMTLYAAYPDPNDPEPDCDGKPNSMDDDDDGDGDPDTEDPDWQPPTAPPAPPGDGGVSLTADGETWHSIDLSWSQFEGQGFGSYKLYRSTEQGFTPNDQTNYIGRGATLENNVAQLEYTDTGLAPATTYYYVLRVAHGGETSDASAQAETIDLPTPNVTFADDQLARACAGGIADDVHQFTLEGVAKRLNENGEEELVPQGTEFKLSFENNRGHDYQNGSEPKKAKFVTSDGNGNPDYVEELTVQADNQGKIGFTVLSSDIISSDIEVKIKWEDANGEEQDAGSKACDFAEAVGKRRFPNQNDPEGAYPEDDNGWLFGGKYLAQPGSQTTAKVYLKFMKDPSLGDVNGNWAYVNGHQVSIEIESIDFQENSESGASQDEYAYLFPEPAILQTATDGAATATVYAGAKIGDVRTIWFKATDLTQWTE